MKFWEAMKALEEGKKVRCKTWSKGGNIYIELPIGSPNKFLSESGRSAQLCISSDLHLFDEWELYEEPVKTYSFIEILPFLKDGKKARRNCFRGDAHIYLKKTGRISWSNGDNFPFSFQDFEVTDWILVEE